MALVTINVNVYGSDASSLAELLGTRRMDGVTFARRTPWWSLGLISRFEITGPPGVIDSLGRQIEAWRTDMWAERQW